MTTAKRTDWDASTSAAQQAVADYLLTQENTFHTLLTLNKISYVWAKKLENLH